MKIAIATIFYNNAAELKRLVESIPPNSVDYWICVDGPFKYNIDKDPDLPRHSNDGSLDIIMDSRYKFNYGFVLSYKPNATEFDKRNTYLEDCKKLGIDCIIIVDSDEYFTYDIAGVEPKEAWARFRKNIELEMIKHPHHNVYGIPFNSVDPKSTDTYKPRIWINAGKMRYVKGSHYHYANMETEARDVEYFNTFGSTYCQHCQSIIKGGVTLSHDHSLRSEDYQKMRTDYQRYLIRYEELIQSGKFTQEECDRMAKENPATNYNP